MTLETKSPGYHLAVDVRIAVHHFPLLRATEIELEIVFFRKTNAAVDLVCGGADTPAGIAGPGLGHGDFPGCLLSIGQTPRRCSSCIWASPGRCSALERRSEGVTLTIDSLEL
jgi:hypothetical protein